MKEKHVYKKMSMGLECNLPWIQFRMLPLRVLDILKSFDYYLDNGVTKIGHTTVKLVFA